MENISHEGVKDSPEQLCSLCNINTFESKRLKTNLSKQIISLKKDKNLKLKTQTVYQTGRAFIRLLKFILNINDNNNCNHKNLYKQFESVTQCSDIELDVLSDHIHIYLAKRNYELDVILTQTKSMSKSILQQIKKVSVQHSISETSIKKEQVEENEKKISFKKFQDQQQTCIANKTVPYVFYNGISVFYSMGLFPQN